MVRRGGYLCQIWEGHEGNDKGDTWRHEVEGLRIIDRNVTQLPFMSTSIYLVPIRFQ
jgi:hypothetical protein